MLKRDDIENPLIAGEGGKPENGFELINKNSYDGYGIYHCHLSSKSDKIIIWYITWNENGYEIKMECINHPNDDYKSIIKDIYNRKDDGFNINKERHFSKLSHMLKEKYIFKFKDF